MLQVIGELILGEFFSEGISGLFKRARSTRGSIIKAAAWLSCLACIMSFVIAVHFPGDDPGKPVLMGIACATITVLFGFWASIENKKIRTATTR